MEMAKVIKCEVSDCVYNRDQSCHTMAITIGDGENPRCDTFCHATRKGGDASAMSGVGACKVINCRYNTDFECGTSAINVGYKEHIPDCLTFQSK